MEKKKLGIVGLGRIGIIHLKNLQQMIPDVEVVAVADPLDKRKEAQIDGPAYYNQYDELIEYPGLDAVVICSPTNTHADFTIKALEAGLDVFCEKPLDLSLEKVKEVVEISKQSKGQLMLGFNRRFDPEFSRIKTLVEQGKVGEPHILKITSRDPGPPPLEYIKVSGGLFVDMAIHDFDMASYIMGSRVKEVFSKAGVLVDPEIGKEGDIDTAITVLYFENSALGVIDNSRKAVYGYDQRLEVFGSKGMSLADNKFEDSHRLYDSGGIYGSLPLHFFLERYSDSYRIEMESFVQALIKDEVVPVTGEDGLISLAVALAAKKSVLENRPVGIEEVM